MSINDTYILAIESSCDETSMAIVKNGNENIKTVVLSQIDIHKKFGGVVPEIASRSHVENITLVLDELFSDTTITYDDIDYIAVTYGPGLIGSLLIGVEFAKALSISINKPLIKVHHVAGHIYANNLSNELQFPLIALVISGGHTDIIYMKDHYEFEKIGGTLDDAVGEAYDKVARVLGLDYPGGPIIDKLSKKGKDEIPLPFPLNDKSYDFSFSGLKSAIINYTHNNNQKNIDTNVYDMCMSFQNKVCEILTKKTLCAMKDYNVKTLIVGGGVSANKQIREEFEKLAANNNFNVSFPEIRYCTDNATMIGAAAFYAKDKGFITDLTLVPTATDKYYSN